MLSFLLIMTVFEHQIFEKFYDFNLQPISIMSTLHAANYAEQSMNCTFDVKMYMHIAQYIKQYNHEIFFSLHTF